ncbi:ferrous iron transport protein B [Pyrococcus abyssi]|uniref:Ferrous iron transport protein B n=1 Tax=Pyrococcus abyssi (strain GE5 / Orsay) TaxID=272844 RepID=Q9UZT1_PYRAB|nr:ferrous iron transport protein B [Pyrococcus abyssi]CAB49975.1 feoB ferrous iron transport protein B homolog GTP-binding [Pyrococcus abyssi GE5]CCE70475.1 TPA: ferrous iron transport protein b-like [Pyrococcus abyssi GE5]
MLKVVALVGNPNVGKTTIFNALTGMRQHVGNWPGVTVEKKEGIMEYKGKEYLVVDLPGIYSLTAHSVDELIARNFILEGNASVIVDIIDSTCLMRNLFLTLELFEMGVKNVIIALNKIDLLKKRGIHVNIKEMEKILGVPVVPTNAKSGEGLDELKRKISLMAEGKITTNPIVPRYDEDIEREIQHVSEVIKGTPLAEKYPIRWLAIKLIQRDEEVIKLVIKHVGQAKIEEILKHVSELEEKYKRSLDIVIASQKYEFLGELLRKFVRHPTEIKETLSDQLDKLLTHPVYGIVSMLVVFYILFQFVFSLGGPLQELLDNAFSSFGEWLGERIANETLRGLVVDGIIGGVGAVLSFFPLVFLLFVGMSILEDSGYLARVAAVMERYLRMFKLPGKAIIPMVLAFGCNVPAVMATRILEEEKDRILTMLVNPLIPCVARMTVITFLAGTFFPDKAALVAVSIYAIAIVLALISALILGKLVVKSEESPFIIELPEYSIPSWKTVVLHSWERSKEFLRKAATVILLGSILIWYLSSYPEPVGSGISYAEKLGRAFEPIARLMGLDWKAAVSLIFGIIAKENVIATYSVIYGVSEESLGSAMAHIMTPLQAYVLALVTTLYLPCIATIAAIRAEGGWKWAGVAVVYNLILATVVGIIAYHIGAVL